MPCVFHKVIAAKHKYHIFVSPYTALISANLTLSIKEHLTINMSVRYKCGNLKYLGFSLIKKNLKRTVISCRN